MDILRSGAPPSNASDYEIFCILSDLVVLANAHPSYRRAFEQAKREAREAERQARLSRTLHDEFVVPELASEAAALCGASRERCERIASEVAVAESRWTIRRELRRLANMARNGVPVSPSKDHITEAADRRHTLADDAALRESGRQFERATRRGRTG